MRIENHDNVTALYSIHQKFQAKFVSFNGYQMPLHYTSGMLNEHIFTRNHCSLFDVSHMGQLIISGENVINEFEKLIPAEISNLNNNHSIYSVLTNINGGVIDDLIVTRNLESIRLVINAANKKQVIEYLTTHLNNCSIVEMTDYSLIAIQGPLSEKVLSNYITGHENLNFMTGMNAQIGNKEIYVSRSGYTGEDGFEISIPNKLVIDFVDELLKNDSIQLAGLGSRDSLRIEAGLCLYGNELTNRVTPVEAKISWIISKNQSTNHFPGSEIIFDQLKNKSKKIRRGIICDGNFIVRKDTDILNINGENIGIVTSGCFSPILNRSIAMAFIDRKYTNEQQKVYFKIRGKIREAKMTNLPFVPHKYVYAKEKAS